MPSRITVRSLQRLTSVPVKKPGKNIPTTCHWMTNAVSANVWWWAIIASGVPVIRRFITPWPIICARTAAMKIGWRTISTIGRAGPLIRTASSAGGGMRRPAISAAASRPSAGTQRYEPRYGGSKSCPVARASIGPRNAAARPPASTKDMARLRNSGSDVSAAAKRYCWAKATETPRSSAAAVRSQNWPCARAATLTPPPTAAYSAPTTKPSRRPTRFMSSDAGMVLSAVPITDIVEGKVARALLLASAERARLPRAETSVSEVEDVAWVRVRRRTFRRRKLKDQTISRPLQLEVFVRRRVGIAGNQADPGLLDARGNSRHGAELVDGHVHDAVVQDTLDLLEQCLALRTIALARLALEQILHFGQHAIRIEARRRHVGLEPRRRVAAGAVEPHQHALEPLIAPGGEIGGALHRPDARTDTDGSKIARERLAHRVERRIRIELPGV